MATAPDIVKEYQTFADNATPNEANIFAPLIEVATFGPDVASFELKVDAPWAKTALVGSTHVKGRPNLKTSDFPNPD